MFTMVTRLSNSLVPSQTEPVNPSTPKPEGQSPATQQCREEEGQVGEFTEQTGTRCLC